MCSLLMIIITNDEDDADDAEADIAVMNDCDIIDGGGDGYDDDFDDDDDKNKEKNRSKID